MKLTYWKGLQHVSETTFISMPIILLPWPGHCSCNGSIPHSFVTWPIPCSLRHVEMPVQMWSSSQQPSPPAGFLVESLTGMIHGIPTVPTTPSPPPYRDYDRAHVQCHHPYLEGSYLYKSKSKTGQPAGFESQSSKGKQQHNSIGHYRIA